MALVSLTLHDFRCFHRTRWELAPGLNLLSSPNASGKSSLLEAVCVLLRLQSPRAATVASAIRRGAPGLSLEGECNGRQLGLHVHPGGRTLLLDEVVQRQSGEYLRSGLVAYFSSADMELVRGPGSPRRRFLDFLGSQCDAGYLRQLRAYERALRARNFLLKETPHRPRELAAYDGPLIASGNYLTEARRGLAERLSPLVTSQAAAIGGRPEAFTVHYAAGAGDDFSTSLAASANEERRLRQTVVGPHRDDLVLQLDEAPAATFASEGQQRTLALALRLAQASLLRTVRQEPPVYLLDDVFGELDHARRRLLLACLPDDAQTILATTSWDWLVEKPPAARFTIRERQVCREAD